jgi:hypothetical protein
VDESPPEKEKRSAVDDRASNADEDFRLTLTPRISELQVRPPCRDVWIEGYLEFIERLNCQAGCEPSPTRALAIAVRRYSTFCHSCLPLHRYSTWSAVHKAVDCLNSDRGTINKQTKS